MGNSDEVLMGNVLKILNSVREGWTVEHRFDSINRYRFDYANIRLKIAVEIEGGVWTKGHTNPKTYIKDLAKYNLAQIKGWIVLRYMPGQENLIANDVRKVVEKRIKDQTEKKI